MADIELKRKESKTVTITITDQNGDPVAVDSAILTLCFVEEGKLADSTVISKADDDFNKTQAANGIVSFNLSSADTDRVGNFDGELKIYFASDDIDKSRIITLSIGQAITD